MYIKPFISYSKGWRAALLSHGLLPWRWHAHFTDEKVYFLVSAKLLFVITKIMIIIIIVIIIIIIILIIIDTITIHHISINYYSLQWGTGPLLWCTDSNGPGLPP